jgi:hypothetical protein
MNKDQHDSVGLFPLWLSYRATWRLSLFSESSGVIGCTSGATGEERRPCGVHGRPDKLPGGCGGRELRVADRAATQGYGRVSFREQARSGGMCGAREWGVTRCARRPDTEVRARNVVQTSRSARVDTQPRCAMGPRILSADVTVRCGFCLPCLNATFFAPDQGRPRCRPTRGGAVWNGCCFSGAL